MGRYHCSGDGGVEEGGEVAGEVVDVCFGGGRAMVGGGGGGMSAWVGVVGGHGICGDGLVGVSVLLRRSSVMRFCCEDALLSKIGRDLLHNRNGLKRLISFAFQGMSCLMERPDCRKVRGTAQQQTMARGGSLNTNSLSASKSALHPLSPLILQDHNSRCHPTSWSFHVVMIW